MWVGVADKLWGLDTWMWGVMDGCVDEGVQVRVWMRVFGYVCGRVCSGEGVQVGVWDRGRACVGGIGMQV